MPIVRIPVELRNTALPSSAYNIWHARVDGFTFQVDTPWDALHTFYTAITSMYAPDTTITFPESVVDVETREEHGVTAPADITTTLGSDELAGVAATLVWKTSVAARRGRGRTFLGPLGSSVFSASTGLINTSVKTTLTNAAQALVDKSSAGNGWGLGVYGQQDAGVATPKLLRDFVGFKVSDKYAHLSSRRD